MAQAPAIHVASHFDNEKRCTVFYFFVCISLWFLCFYDYGAPLRGFSYRRSSAIIRCFTAGIVNIFLTNHIEHCILL